MSLFGGRRKDSGGSGESSQASGTAGAPESVSGLTSRGPKSSESTGYQTTQASEAGSEGSASAARDDRGTAPQREGGTSVANIGKSIHIKGDLIGEEDLEIEGQVDGQISLPNSELTIGAHGQVTGELKAKSIVVVGQVSGNLIATERAEIQASGSIEGDIKTPRLLVQEGAIVNGTIEMSRSAADAATRDKPSPKPLQPPRQQGGQQPPMAAAPKS
jgi:cytoskeletal protein CcmA (bactofilin family)